MNIRPAGYSSDEDDDFNNFSFNGEIKSEKKQLEEIAVKEYNERCDLFNTASNRFHTAIIISNLDQIQKEISEGFDVNKAVISDWTPLLLSTAHGNVVVVEELLKNGANPNLTKDGFTTVMSICDCSKSTTSSENVISILKLLLEKHVDFKAKDRKRRTAFMLACSQGFIEVVQFLFSLSELEAQDNQGWTALFYAVNSNNIEIVKFLLENDSNIEHIDLRNNNVRYYASLYDYQEILNSLPKSDFESCPQDFISTNYDYELVFNSLSKNERPKFTQDISFLLYGMNCQNLISLFIQNDIDLYTFLTTNDTQLKEFGVEMSFQRTNILQGLIKFHNRRWGHRSIPHVSQGDIYDTHDMFIAITNAVKQITVLEASIKYLENNFGVIGTQFKNDQVTTTTTLILRKINRIKKVSSLLHDKALRLKSAAQQPADLITNKKLRKNSLNNKVILGFVSITLFYISRYFILRNR